MKFPVPKTLRGAISPMLLIDWVFGIGVIEYPIGRLRRMASAFWSITIFLIYVGILWTINFAEIVKAQQAKVGLSSYHMIVYFCAALIAISIYLAQIKAKVITRTISKLTHANDRLEKLGIPKDYGLFYKTQIIQLGIAFSFMFILIVVDFEYVPIEFPSKISRIGYLLACDYLLVFTYVVDYFFGGSIRYFGNRFQRLNTLLEELDLLNRSETTVTRFDHQFSCSSVIHEIHGSNRSSIKAANKQWLLYVIQETRKIHRCLCKTAMELNRACGIQVCFSMALSFSLLTVLLYTFYTITMAPFANNLAYSIGIVEIMPLMWLTFIAMKVILIVDACENTSCEAHRTRGLINKLLSAAACDEDIREEINIFSLQLLQNPLRFTANGFFALDYSLIHGIIGSVTTYLVIMIQMGCIYDIGNMSSTPNSTIPIQTNARRFKKFPAD